MPVLKKHEHHETSVENFGPFVRHTYSSNEMHTDTHPLPSHGMPCACERDMDFYVQFDFCSHHFLLFVSSNATLHYCSCYWWCTVVLVPLFGNSFSSCFYVSFVIFAHISVGFYSQTLSSIFFVRLYAFSGALTLILHILRKIGFNMIYLRFTNMYYDCNIQLTWLYFYAACRGVRFHCDKLLLTWFFLFKVDRSLFFPHFCCERKRMWTIQAFQRPAWMPNGQTQMSQRETSFNSREKNSFAKNLPFLSTKK